MIKVENVDIYGWEAAIRGMRNPKNSWAKSDSCFDDISCEECPKHMNELARCEDVMEEGPRIGLRDHGLMMALRNSGTDHRKFMRMIVVYMDITAPFYWWKEFDTYKVGTVANSCSTMHKLMEKEFEVSDFSVERFLECCNPTETMTLYVELLNNFRNAYLLTKDKKYWDATVQFLLSSYNQKRTVMLNYEVLANMYKSRKDHKLMEWRTFCGEVKKLPLSELITGEEDICETAAKNGG